MSDSRIRVKAIAIIRRGAHEVLLSFAIDPATGRRYGRFLGGAVEPGEQAADAIVRELREELGVDLCDVERMDVVENIYQHGGQRCHEVVFVFAGRFCDETVYRRESFPVNEAICDGPARWVPATDVVRGTTTVYPPELVNVLARLFGSNPIHRQIV